jgi:hypothetical protein
MKHRVPGGVSNPSSSGGPRARGATARGRDTSSAAGARVQRAIDSPPHRVGTSSPRTARHLALGRPELSLHGRWLAAVLSCGPGAVLSHEPAAELWKIHPVRHHRIEVSVLPMWCVRPRGIVVHHRKTLAPREVECRYGIPVTSPLVTLIHIGTRLDRRQLESAINQADKRDLVSPEELRAALDDLPRRPWHRSAPRAARQADLHPDRLRARAPLRSAGAQSRPAATQDGLVRERIQSRLLLARAGNGRRDGGLRYHRTPSQQAGDRVRD